MRSNAVKTLRLWGSLAIITWYCAQHYTMAHPFLLADNRLFPASASLYLCAILISMSGSSGDHWPASLGTVRSTARLCIQSCWQILGEPRVILNPKQFQVASRDAACGSTW